MIDIAWTFALHMAGLLAFAVLLRLMGRQISMGALLTAVGVSAIWWASEVLGASVQAHIPGFSHLHWSWVGKVLAVVSSLILITLLPKLTRADAGLTWRQKAGWLGPVLLVMAITCAISWIAQSMSHEGRQLAQERLLFQATMPGLDEELFWRGLLLALLTRAFGPGRELAGGSFGPAEIAVTLLFAAGHGLRLSQGAIAFDATAFMITGLIGAGLMWLRTRTGSLVIPILTHNLVNVGNSFF